MNSQVNEFTVISPLLQTEGVRFIHRLLLWRYGIPVDFVLNSGQEPEGEMSILPLAADLYRLTNLMKAEAYDSEHGQVNYAQLRTSLTYVEYRKCARRLQTFDPATLSSREEQLAFWINLYNALVVDAVVQFEVKQSVTEVPGFFWRAAYAIGGRRYCAFDIEYGILRANAPHPAIPGLHFGRRDPRRSYSLAQLDPRIHFALVCAARSCPPIAVYGAGQIDRQLDMAAQAFINGGGVRLERTRGEVWLSQIFQWYASDFGGRPFGLGDKRPLLKFVARYWSEVLDREALLQGSLAVRFQPYDWNLNQSLP